MEQSHNPADKTWLPQRSEDS